MGPCGGTQVRLRLCSRFVPSSVRLEFALARSATSASPAVPARDAVCAPRPHPVPLARTQAVLAVAAVVMGLGQTTLFTFLPLLMQHTGLSLAQLTLAFAVGSGLFLVGAPGWALLSDRLGRRTVVAVALAGFAASHALLLWQVLRGAEWAWQAQAMFAGRAIYGLTVSGLVSTCQAWLADVTTAEQRLAAMSRLSAGLTLGRLLGPALAAASLWVSPHGPLWLVAVAAWPALIALPWAGAGAALPRQASGPREGAGASALWRWLALALAMQMAMGQVQYAVGPWLGRRFGLDAVAASASMGWMLTACALAVMVLQLWVVPRCTPGRRLLLLGGGLLVVSGALFAWAPAMAALWLGFIALGAAAAVLVPTYTTLASLAAGRAGQSRVSGCIAAAHTVGFSLSAALAGALFGWSPMAPFWLTASLGASIWLLGSFGRLPRRSDAADAAR